VTSAASAVLTYIAHRDEKLMRRVNRWYAPRWIRIWMVYATRCGDGWLWYAVGLALLFFGGEHRYAAFTSAALAAAAGVTVFLRLKKFARRRRPCMFEPHCWATLLPPDQFSFPSGHTITAFAVTSSIAHFYPELAAALLFCALCVATSRILLGMHFLSDVVAGAAIGTLLAYGATDVILLLGL
jgi:undecaprenyl-diphosphatase